MTVAASQNIALRNHLLAALPADDFRRVSRLFEPVFLEPNQVLYEFGERSGYAYFPTTAIVFLRYIMSNGSTAAIGIVGNEGVIGTAIYMGSETASHRTVVQNAGEAARIKAAELHDEFNRGGRFQLLLLRYTMALLAQVSQTVVCSRFHSVEKQLCRWLLFSHDRSDSDSLPMTHEIISKIIGVRREVITRAAQKLQQRRLITNNRGNITIIDRHGLEAAVCECYEIVNNEYNRLLGRGISRTFG